MSDPSRPRLKRFVVLVQSNDAVESGVMPTEGDLAAMIRFNDWLAESGAMLAAEGLLNSSNGARITFTDKEVRVQNGPFAHPETLVAGYWIIQAASLDEAIGLMQGAPMGGAGATVEIRQIAEAEDFGARLTPELRDREDRQRVRMEENARRGAA